MTDSNPGGTLARRPQNWAQRMAQYLQKDTVLRFVHISDTHISHDPTYSLPEAKHTPAEAARALVEAINNLPFAPDFVMHTGDVAYDPVPRAYKAARDILKQIKYPVYYLSGNHDHCESLQKIVVGRDEVKLPYDYEFEVKGVQIVCVDSNAPAKPPAGAVTAEQLAWLSKLASDKTDTRPMLVMVHHNVLPTGVPWWDDFMRMTNGEDFHRALLPAQPRLRGVFHGHVHQGVDIFRDGILYSSVVSSWYQIHSWPGQTDTLGDFDNKPGYNVVTVTPQQTFIRRHHFEVEPTAERTYPKS